MASSMPDNPSLGTANLDNHLRLVQNVDWTATSLGPMDSWPQELLLLFHLISLDPQPRALLLGEERTLLYNYSYGEMVGSRHPGALGSPQRVAFPEA